MNQRTTPPETSATLAYRVACHAIRNMTNRDELNGLLFDALDNADGDAACFLETLRCYADNGKNDKPLSAPVAQSIQHAISAVLIDAISD